MKWNPPYRETRTQVVCVHEPLQIVENHLRNHIQGRKKNKKKVRHLLICAPTHDQAFEYFWRIMAKVDWRDGGV